MEVATEEMVHCGDLRSMTCEQFLSATKEHNKSITNKSVTSLLRR